MKFKQDIGSLTLIPTGGGAFEVKVGDDLIYSKLKTGQFPEPEDIVAAVRGRLS